MTPEEAKEVARVANLVAASKIYVEALHDLGVRSYVIGYALDEDPEGQGMTKIEGNATLVLNLIASVVKGMRPEDFKNLLGVMMFGDYFSDQRAKIGMVDKVPDGKKDLVN